MRTPEDIHSILIDASLQDGAVAQSIGLQRPPSSRVEVVPDAQAVLSAMRRGDRPSEGTLVVLPFRGSFVSGCPGSDGMVCCNYYVINLGVGCIFDCHYCYLQSFMNHPAMTVFGNLDDLYRELDFKLRNPKVRFRVGTGEYTDSLALDALTGIAPH